MGKRLFTWRGRVGACRKLLGMVTYLDWVMNDSRDAEQRVRHDVRVPRVRTTTNVALQIAEWRCS